MRQDNQDMLTVSVMVVICVVVGLVLGKMWSRPLAAKRAPAALHQREKGLEVGKYYKIMQDKDGDVHVVLMTSKEIVERYKRQSKKH
jgi:hypothetical protein